MSRESTYKVGPDDRLDLVDFATEQMRFLDDLERAWTQARPEWLIKPGADSFAMGALAGLLDELVGFCICDEPGCLAPCHEGWDFCKQHGEKKP